MAEPVDVTIWRLVGSFENPNQMREELIAQATIGEFLGLRVASRSFRTVACGWVFRFVDHRAASAFEESVGSHELPPEESEERVERQPHEDDDVPMLRPGTTEPVMVKRKRMENLLKKGWTDPQAEKPASSAEKPKKKKKQKVKEKKVFEPAKIPEPFVATPDDWVVMLAAPTGDFVRVKRHRVDYMRSVGWKEGWALYRAKFHELERLKVQLTYEMAEIKASIVALENKEDSNE